MTLKIITQPLNSRMIENLVTGFILNHENSNYIISVHHFLPINAVLEYESETPLNIKINSSWSEALILETNNMDFSKYKIFSKVHNNIPKPDCPLFIKVAGKRLELQITGYEMLPFDNIQSDITIPIIKTRSLTPINNLAGLSGSPVFIKNKIVGVFSKIRPDDNTLYIIPIYIFIKNLEKNNNSRVFTTDIKNIKKIGSWVVNKDYEIYHPTMKFNIPINSYFLIEGDINFKTIIYYDDDKPRVDLIPAIVKKNLASDCDNNLLVRNNSEYKITTRLLSYLKTFEFDDETLYKLVMLLTKTTNEYWLKVEDNKFSICS